MESSKKQIIIAFAFLIMLVALTGIETQQIEIIKTEYTQIQTEHITTTAQQIEVIQIHHTLYDELTENQKEQLTGVIMAAAGNESYKGKYLVACVLRNRVNKYGIYKVLTTGHVEKPFYITNEIGYELQQRNKQLADAQQAFKTAFNNNGYPELMYYQNPLYSTDDGLAFFSKLEYILTEGGHSFYNEG